jgi:hypothetical protein
MKNEDRYFKQTQKCNNNLFTSARIMTDNRHIHLFNIYLSFRYLLLKANGECSDDDDDDEEEARE